MHVSCSSQSYRSENVSELLIGRSLGFSAQKSQFFVVGGRNFEIIKMRRARTLELSKYKKIQQSSYESSVFSMDLEAQDKRYLLCGCSNGSISIIDLDVSSQTPECEAKTVGLRKRLGTTSSKHCHDSMVVSCQWYPQDTGMFSTASTDRTLRVWDSNRLKTVDIFRFETPINHHHWSKGSVNQSAMIAVALGMSNVKIVDVRNGAMTQQLKGHTENVSCVQWSPKDSNILCSSGKDGRIIFWDVRSGKTFLKSLVSKNSLSLQGGFLSNGVSAKSAKKRAHGGVVNGLKFTPDGLFLLSFGTEGFLKKWDAVTLKEILNKESHPKGFHFPGTYTPRKLVYFDLAYFGDKTVIYIPTDDDIEMVSFSTGESLGTLRGHYNPVNSCVYRQSYQELYSGGSDKNLLCWTPKMDQNQMYMEEKRMGGKQNLYRILQDTWSDSD